jgi:archaellum component FlaC
MAGAVDLRASIIASLDDIAATIDGFTQRFDRLDDELIQIHERLAKLEDKVSDDPAYSIRELESRISDISTTVENLPQDIREMLDNDVLPDVSELVDGLRRKELQEIREDARAGMKKSETSFAF